MEWIEIAMGLLSMTGIGLLVYNLFSLRHLRQEKDEPEEDEVTNYQKLQYLESSADFAVKAAERTGDAFNAEDKHVYACQIVVNLLDVLNVEHAPELVDAAVRKAQYDLQPKGKSGFC